MSIFTVLSNVKGMGVAYVWGVSVEEMGMVCCVGNCMEENSADCKENSVEGMGKTDLY